MKKDPNPVKTAEYKNRKELRADANVYGHSQTHF